MDRAVELVNRALKAEPESGAYLDSLGWAWFKLAKAGGQPTLQEALQKLIYAAERNRKEEGGEDPVILDHIATVYYCLGDWETAKTTWEACLARAKEMAKERPNALPNADQVRKLLKWVTDQMGQEGARGPSPPVSEKEKQASSAAQK